MRQIEKRLRDRVADKLMDTMTSRSLKVDYKSLTQTTNEIYSEVMEGYRASRIMLDVPEDTDRRGSELLDGP